MDQNQRKLLYDEQKRGAQAPDYTPAENEYRNRILNGLQMSYKIREMCHMELDDKTYSEYYLINRQQDMAYNPPKRNMADVRLNSGIIHEKDTTIQSIITSMNFQPKVCVFNHDDTELTDAATVFTARIKRSLIMDNFDEKIADFARIQVSQGNVFMQNMRNIKFEAKKIQIGNSDDPTKKKWKTVVEEVDRGQTTIALPNTSVFMSNILEKNLRKQPRVWAVLHIPTVILAQTFKDFPRWKNVPKTLRYTIPTNTDGVWGDYFLQQPSDDYMEFILTESEIENDYNVFLNGTMMYPIQEENGVITGYPLTEFSPSGHYTIVKGDNEPIPFFAYGRSEPSKNEVKEESINEMMRLMFYKARQAAKPPIGNNTDRILPSNLWDAGVITPDIQKEELSILTPNAGITQSDFNFVSMLHTSVDDTTVSQSIEGANSQDVSATQYVDQKKENLKKLAIVLDNTVNYLKEIFWLRLYDEMMNIDKKQKVYDAENDKFIEAYTDFAIEDNINGQKGKTHIHFMDDTSGLDEDQMFQEEYNSPTPVKHIYVRPDYIKAVIQNLRDKIYIDVVSEPEGEQTSLLGALFNTLTAYANLRGGQVPNLNYDYLDKIISENSGFESDKIFLKTPPQMTPPNPLGMPGQPQIGPDGQPIQPQEQTPNKPMSPTQPTPQNKILAGGMQKIGGGY